MQRLIKDAAQMTDVQKELGVTVDESSMSFGNVVNAISVMQKSMGIAGTTAKEGATTISGSISMLGAAWDNFLTGIFDENADMGVLGEQLIDSVGAVLMNVGPRIAIAITRIIQGLPAAIGKALTALPGMVEPMLTEIFGEQMGGKINEIFGGSMSGLGDTLAQTFQGLQTTVMTLWETLQPVLELLGSAFTTAFTVITTGVQAVLDIFNNNVLPMVNSILEIIRPVIEQIAADLQEKMPAIQETMTNVMNGIKTTIDTVWPAISQVVLTAVQVIADVIQAVWPVISQIIDVAMQAINFVVTNIWPIVADVIVGACNVIKGIIDVVWPVVRTIVEGVCTAIQGIVSTVWPIISGIVKTACDVIKGAINGIQTIVGVVTGIFNSVRSAIEGPINTAKDIVHNAIEAIKGFFNFNIQWPHIPLPHFSVSGSANPLDWLTQGPPSISIDWYAKGGFVDDIHLIGVGEAGPEMILPQHGAMMTDFAQTIVAEMGGRDDDTDELLRKLLEKSGDVYMDGRLVGNVVAPFVDARLATTARRASYA